MMNEADRKFLLGSVSPKRLKTQLLLFVASILMFLCGGLHLGLAAYVAHLRGENLLTVFAHWSQGFEIGKRYSGSYLYTLEQLSAGFLYFAAAAMNISALVSRRREGERSQRIINALKQSGSWQQ